MPGLLAHTHTSAFKTELGWIALAYHSPSGCPVLLRLAFGHPSKHAALRAIASPRNGFEALGRSWPHEVGDWIDRLTRYAQGQQVSLQDVPIDESHLTPFGRKVHRLCRQIPFGQARSYGQLAAAAGRPRAARAVGSVMSGNRTPLVAPCHRVLGSGGRLGGFSAPQGIAMKQRLLALEQKHHV